MTTTSIRPKISEVEQARQTGFDAGYEAAKSLTQPESTLAIWQTFPCPSWCEWIPEGGHFDVTPSTERWHTSEWLTIDRPTLNVVEPRFGGTRLRRTGARLEVSANTPGRPAQIRIATEGDDGEMPTFNQTAWATIVSASEALELAEMIRTLAARAINEQLPPSSR